MVTVWAVTPVVVVMSDEMMPPVRPLALNVMVGTLVPANPFWKVIVNGPLPATTVLPLPMFGSALSHLDIAGSVAAVELHVIAAVVRPLNVRVNVPLEIPLPKVRVWTALTPPEEARMPVLGAEVSVDGLVTIRPATCAASAAARASGCHPGCCRCRC